MSSDPTPSQPRPRASNWWGLSSQLPIDERELDYLPDDAAKDAARAHVQREMLRDRSLWLRFTILLLMWLIAAIVIVLWLKRYVDPRLPPWIRPFYFPLISGFAGWACLVAALHWRRGLATRALRDYLTSQGIPVCAGCGYNLSAIMQPRCPECGRATG